MKEVHFNGVTTVYDRVGCVISVIMPDHRIDLPPRRRGADRRKHASHNKPEEENNERDRE